MEDMRLSLKQTFLSVLVIGTLFYMMALFRKSNKSTDGDINTAGFNDRNIAVHKNHPNDVLFAPDTALIRPVNDNYMKTLEYVCVQGQLSDQKLIVYNSLADTNSTYMGHFPVKYKRRGIPSVFTYHKETVAFFIPTRWPNNFFHNIEDALVPAYLLIRDTNRLIKKPNVLYEKVLSYRRTPECQPPNICNIVTPFMKLLPIKWPPTRFGHAKSKICYRYGVVHIQTLLTNDFHIFRDRSQRKVLARREIARYIHRESDIIDNMVCPNKDANSDEIVTIIQREGTRKITNIGKVKARLIRGGVKKVIIAKMEEMTMVEQVHLVYCTDVLVGAHGAGLMWTMFMQPNTALIELAWPDIHENVGFFYTKMFINDSSTFVFPLRIGVNDVTVMPDKRLSPHWFRFVTIKVNEGQLLSTTTKALATIRLKRQHGGKH